MTLFFLLAALLVVASLTILLPLLSGDRLEMDRDHREANIAIARERQSTLRRAMEGGEIDQETFDAEMLTLEGALASDLNSTRQSRRDTRGRVFAVAAVAIVVPVSAGLLYMELGTPQALDADFVASSARQANASSEETQAPAIDELIPQLEARLAAVPDDIEGWRLLGRTRLMVGDHAGAADALSTANELAPEHPDTLASLAEATAMASGGSLAGEPLALLNEALAIDPDHPQSRWLLAIARQQSGDHAGAITLFEGLAAELGDDPQALASVNQMIERSRQAGSQTGGSPPVESAAANSDNGAEEPVASSQADAPAIELNVSLDLPAGTPLEPTQKVFVYARATQGPPMPLAARRLTVADLPVIITLDTSAALVPGMDLSSHEQVTVGARVSMNNDAIAKPGDWIGEVQSVPVRDAGQVEIRIDAQVPAPTAGD